jgi:hypothetical protein
MVSRVRRQAVFGRRQVKGIDTEREIVVKSAGEIPAV